jgi:hypothetical protein
VIGGVVQEIDIRTGKVLVQWNSADHVPYTQSEQPLPASASTSWDRFHINAVHLDTDHSLLIDARTTWTTYKVNRHSGAVIWQLGGKASSFTLQAGPGQVLDDAGEIFAWQHDPEALGRGVHTLFDNEASFAPELAYSRAVTVQLDGKRHTATLVATRNQPEGLSAPSQGNAQTTPERSRIRRLRGPLASLRASGPSVGRERRPQQRHAVPLEARGDRGAVGAAAPRERAELLVEPMASAGGVDHDDLPRLVHQVEERVRDAGRQVGEPAHVEVERLVADGHPVAAGQHVDRLLLPVVHVQRRPAAGRDLDDEVVERPSRVVARHLEHEVPPRT